MLTISPLLPRPDHLETCIAWSDREWRALTGFTTHDWQIEFHRMMTAPVDEIFVALLDDMPVGMVWMIEKEGLESHAHLTPWLSNLVVDAKHRGRGIGRALVSHVAHYVALGGDPTLHLLTHTPAVYLNMGWDMMEMAELRKRPIYVMSRDLSYLHRTRLYGT